MSQSRDTGSNLESDAQWAVSTNDLSCMVRRRLPCSVLNPPSPEDVDFAWNAVHGDSSMGGGMGGSRDGGMGDECGGLGPVQQVRWPKKDRKIKMLINLEALA